MAHTPPKNEPTMDPSSVEAENSGGDGQCKTIKIATTEAKALGIVLIKDGDDARHLKISTNENDAITRVDNDAKGYEHFGKGAVF